MVKITIYKKLCIFLFLTRNETFSGIQYMSKIATYPRLFINQPLISCN